MHSSDQCAYCRQIKDVRPYGENSSMICFQCMTASPEREAEAKKQFHRQLDACGDRDVVIGTSAGPYPVDHHLPQQVNTITHQNGETE